nr:dihydrolipoyl dehydrogenase [Bacilli bacterium]
MAETFDVMILGGGTGGYVAAIRASQLGLSVAVVEADKLGGTCLHQGCIPSKALLRSAELFHAVQDDAFGIVSSDLHFDLPKAMDRKQKIVDQLHKGVAFLMKKNQVRVIEGYGRIMGPSIFSPSAGAVRVEYADGETEIFTPKHTIIATGSKPRALPQLPFDGEWVISSDDALRLETLPDSLLIVGAGAIGLEWASMMADLGVKVTLLEALPQILPQEDEEVAKEMARLLKKRKVEVFTNATLDAASVRDENGISMIDAVIDNERKTFTPDKILVAIGRKANVDDIGLEATNVVVERGVIVVDAQMRTAESSIFAIGDVIGRLQLAHVASHEGILAVEAIAGITTEEIDYTKIPRCTYTRPEVASVGITEKQAKEQGYEIKVGKYSLRAHGKAMVYGENDGFVKIIADAKTDDLLGVHILGPHATELIAQAALSEFLDATPFELGTVIHAHPTLSEAIGEAALIVQGRGIHG